jgi:hypothetical protein
MKSKIKIFFLSFVILGSGISISSCSRGSGCPAETANVKPNRKGSYTSRKGSSNLFPKDMRKKVGVKN